MFSPLSLLKVPEVLVMSHNPYKPHMEHRQVRSTLREGISCFSDSGHRATATAPLSTAVLLHGSHQHRVGEPTVTAMCTQCKNPKRLCTGWNSKED